MTTNKPMDDVPHQRANTDGLGRPAPPVVSREIIEQQRACERLASQIAEQLAKSANVEKWNIEADISSTITRLVVHYMPSNYKSAEERGSVEVDFGPGSPIDQKNWLKSVAMEVVRRVQSGESDFLTLSSLNYLRLIDEKGRTLFERGKEW